MSGHAAATGFQRAAAAAGGLICLVVILAMFSEPAREGSALPLTPGTQPPASERVVAFRFTAENVLGLVVIGLISATFGSMLGMGGGVMKMSFLLFFFSFHPGISRFAALLAYFVTTVGAAYRYMKLRLVMMDVVKVLVPSSILGIVFGAVVGHHLTRDIMTILLGTFLLFICVVMVRRLVVCCGAFRLGRGDRARGQDEATGEAGPQDPDVGATGPRLAAPAAWKTALCGFPGGFLSAMLGISGGVVTTPLQHVLARIPIKNAIANTLTKASVTVPIACLMIMVMGVRAGHFDFWTPVLVALCLVPGSVVGSQLGPALTGKMSSVAIYALFCAVALFMGINMLFFSG